MSSNQPVTFWIGKLKEGDPQAAQELWQQYFARLVSLVRQKLRGVPLRVSDEEDVALSAFDSFFGGVKKGRFPRLDDRDDLWQILMVLASWKVVNLRRHQGAEKRADEKIRGESAFMPLGDDSSEQGGIGQVVGEEPTPEIAVTVAEECRRLLDCLGDELLQQIALLKMEGYTNEEIAERLGCVRRTIDRKLKRIRSIWSRESPEAIDQPRETE